MRTNEHKILDAKIVLLKQESVSRHLLAAQRAVLSGEARPLPRTSSVPYARKLRVKAT